MKLPFPPNLYFRQSSSLQSFFSTSSPHLNPSQFDNLFKLAGQLKIHKHATQLHSKLIVTGYLSSPLLFNSLLGCYSNCGRIDQTLLLFSQSDNAPLNVVSWTSFIAQLSRFDKLEMFNQMRRTGVWPNEYTFSAVLPACAESLLGGEQVHSLIWKCGVGSDLFVGSALVDMYAKCGEMGFANKVFDEMPQRNLVSWNSMIVGFLRNGVFGMAIGFFKKVVGDDCMNPDQVSVSSVLSACAHAGTVEFGRLVHGVAVKCGMLGMDYVRNSLMDMYCKCGLIDYAARTFDIITDKDVVAWNVMIRGCSFGEYFEEAYSYFVAMTREGNFPDESSYSSVLYACANLATLNQGLSTHGQIMKSGMSRDNFVASSLVTMYSKCGSFCDASRVFEELGIRNVVCWTAMIAACQQHGHWEKVIELFDEMIGDGIKPDDITFVCVISACSHAGRVEEGYNYFNSMACEHGLSPRLEHYASVVDLLGRAGLVNEAKKFISEMQRKPDSTVWGALLGACTNYGNLEIGKEAADKLFELEPDDPGNYVLLANMYARNGKLKEADQVRRLMGSKGVKKEPGCSWVDIKNSTYVFTAHDRSHPRADEIYAMLRTMEELAKKKGYVAETQYAMNNADGYREQSLWYHSERLALAFALIVLPSGAPIRIKKNLRTCGDCHTVMKLASEIFDREIIVRDINRFHRVLCCVQFLM
ncbi:Putative pentatricopeptide repeat-containing protein At3g23330 [Linum perenne]